MLGNPNAGKEFELSQTTEEAPGSVKSPKLSEKKSDQKNTKMEEISQIYQEVNLEISPEPAKKHSQSKRKSSKEEYFTFRKKSVRESHRKSKSKEKLKSKSKERANTTSRGMLTKQPYS